MKWRHDSSDPADEQREKIKRVLRRTLGFNYQNVISEPQLEQVAERVSSMEVVHASELSALAAEVAGNPQLFSGAEPTLNVVLAESRGELSPPPAPRKRPLSE
jgi:hypothetical protein